MSGRDRANSNSKAVIGPYPDDGARRMPSSSSASYLEAARNQRLQISARGGRTSTNLAGRSAGAGLQSYVNNFLGQTA